MIGRSAPRYIKWKNGAWFGHWRYVDPDGTVRWPSPRSPYTDRKRDERRAAIWAGDRRRKWIEEHEAGLAARGFDAPTLRSLVTAYEAEVGAAKPSWCKGDRNRAARLLQELPADKPIADVTPQDVFRMRDRLAERPGRRDRDRRTELSHLPPGRPKTSNRPAPDTRARKTLRPRSINAYLVLLQAILNHAARTDRIPTNHLRGRIPKLAEPVESVAETLSLGQMRAIFLALADWERWSENLARNGPRESVPAVPLRGIILLGYYTAARPSNYLALRWYQVRWATKEVVFETSKNRRPVVIPMEAPLEDYLRGLYHGQAATALVHPSAVAGRPWTNLYHQWRRLIDFANRRLEPSDRLPIGTRLYILRHTRATDWAEAGVAPKVVADLLGDRLDTVERRYFGRRPGAARYWIDLAAQHPSVRAISEAASGVVPGPKDEAKTLQKSSSKGEKKPR